MVHLCHTSFWNWTQVEECTEQNLSIGYWQLSRVYSEVENGEQALYFASRCLSVSVEAQLAPFYIAYAYEAVARAQVILNQIKAINDSLSLAEKYTSEVKDEESKKLLMTDIEAIKEARNRLI